MSLHTEHRPKTLSEVLGQDAVVKALAGVLKRREAHTFLFSGPSGCGKTTLARIAARTLGAEDRDIMDIDAATHTGVDDVRAIKEVVAFRPLGGGKARGVVVDECHSLSKNAWQALLKATEEPPAHLFWFLCTTEPDKVPATIKTRAVSYQVKPVPEKTLGQLYDRVCAAEKIDLPGDVGDMVIREAGGSPRQMLLNLETCRDVRTRKEAAELLRIARESDPVRELCQFLVQRGSWVKAMGIVEKLKDENPESVRIVVCNYFAAVAKGAKSDKSAGAALTVLDAFSTPYNASENSAPLLLSIGRVLFGE